MKNKHIIFLIIICLIQILNISAFAKEPKQDEKKIILIDPGHGGIDGGAVSKNGTVEKDINLSISKLLKEELIKNNYAVAMTREEDISLHSTDGSIRNKKYEDLNARSKMKTETNCHMFISIHLNMFPQEKYYGAQVWYGNNDESKKFAEIVQNNLIADLANGNMRKEKPALNSYKILRGSEKRAEILVECGFLSNYDEEQKLKDLNYQKKIVTSIVKSIKQYYSE